MRSSSTIQACPLRSVKESRGLRSRRAVIVLLVPAAVFIVALLIYPLISAAYGSLFDFSMARPYMGRTFVALMNYVHALRSTELWLSVLRTVILTVVAVGLEVAVGLLVAILLNKNIPGISFFRSIVIIPIFLTPVVVGHIWKFILNVDFGLLSFVFRQIGLKPISLLGSYWLALPVVIFVDFWQHTPFGAFLFLAGLKSLSSEVFEAASIDGVTPWQMTRYITLPLLKPVILTVLTIRSYDVFKTFDSIFVLTGGGPIDATRVLSIFLYKEAFVNLNTGYSLAISWMILVLTLMLISSYFVLLREKKEF